MAFNPDKWATSMWTELRSYLNTFIPDDIYELQLGYPDVLELTKTFPLLKTLIHFDILDVEEMKFGLGENSVNDFYDESGQTIQQWEAHNTIVHFDVGIWASAGTGGINARLNAMERLTINLTGPRAREEMMLATDGLELLSFTGGRFILDQIADHTVWRTVDTEMRLRVLWRRKLAPIPSWEDITPEPGIEIDETIIIG
jgi:hypothetical protein